MTDDPDLARQSGVAGAWLRALAGDADAAIAAALAYEACAPEARDAWLDVVGFDLAANGTPPIAAYAPLLGVEEDPARRARIVEAIRGAGGFGHCASPHALGGVRPDGARVWVLVAPLWLEFVEVVAAACDDGGFRAFAHVPLARACDPVPDMGVSLAPAHVGDAVEQFALALLANDRSGRARPPGASALLRFLGPEQVEEGPRDGA